MESKDYIVLFGVAALVVFAIYRLEARYRRVLDYLMEKDAETSWTPA